MAGSTQTQTMQGGFDKLAVLLRRGDIALALILVAILLALIVPMPRMLLDLSLALSITLSVMVLMTALFIEKPLDFSSFPMLLLITTMLRLSLNVASTRLILTYGHEGPSAAGEVIRAFGDFIMSGNFVIGVIVFAILVIINFVVITKGSGRIAEVSARFSLDALPGKQMAVDADLSAGLINDVEAKARRKELENEANFYGAMDGAAKFVRGDAIAGLLITFINVVAGIFIGVAQKGLTFGEAGHTYTLLTVGDGLVTQIPALIVSTAAGILVSKGGVVGSADKALFGQLSAFPTALGVSSFLMLMMSFMPGVPMLPFLTLSLLTGFSAWKINELQEKTKIEAALNTITEATQEKADPVEAALMMDNICLEIGYALLPLAQGKGVQKITDNIKIVRKQLASELGFVLPSVRVQDNIELPAEKYVIKIKDLEVGTGFLKPHMLLVMNPSGGPIELPGEATVEPTFGLSAMWILTDMRPQAEAAGYTVVDASTVVTTHLTEVIKDHLTDLFSFSELQKLLEKLDKSEQKLVADMVPAHITFTTIQRVLQNLLSERISIRDLSTIIEAISEASSYVKTPTGITEHVRMRLARQLCANYAAEDGILHLVSLSPLWEQAFNESLVGEGEQRQLSMPPSRMHEFVQKMRTAFDEQSRQGVFPVLLTSSMIRPYVRSIVERFSASTHVMSQGEIHPKARIKTVAQI